MNLLISVLILVVFHFNNCIVAKDITRKAKFWTWGIGFVRFENGVCRAVDGLDGTCYTRRQCSNIGGLNSGKCAQVGACCVVQQSCGGISAYNNTYFVNPDFPRTVLGGTSCVLTIRRCNPEICQVRIDFLSLTLAQPDGIGRCINDALTISGASSRIPPICGENSGQHIYLDFNGAEDIRISVDTISSISLSRLWKLKISQIECGSPSRAPSGCLMYYTDVSGTVQSFNYGSTESSQLTAQLTTGTRQLINQNYGVCVAMSAGYCSIEWSQSQTNSFTVSHDTTAASEIIGTPAASFAGQNCTSDFVVIPNPMIDGVAVNYDRFCGNGIPTATTFSKPFVLTVVTDGDEADGIANRGFSLDYTQRRCASLNLL